MSSFQPSVIILERKETFPLKSFDVIVEADQHSLDICASLVSSRILQRKLSLWRPFIFTGLGDLSGRLSITSLKQGSISMS